MKFFRLFALVAFSFFVSSNVFAASPNTNSGANFSPNQVKNIQKIVRNYLIKNPEVLIEVSEALQKRQAFLAQKNAMTAIQKNRQQLFKDPKTPTAGNSAGTVYLVEFFDYQCGHCKTMGSIIESLLKQNKNVKMVFKDLPIFGGASKYAAKMALASSAQGKYYQFHNALFQAGGPLNQALIVKIAKKVGLNIAKLKKDAASPWVNKQLRANFRLAQQLKLVGTPAFVVANKQLTKFRFIPGATSQNNLNKQITAVEN